MPASLQLRLICLHWGFDVGGGLLQAVPEGRVLTPSTRNGDRLIDGNIADRDVTAQCGTAIIRVMVTSATWRNPVRNGRERLESGSIQSITLLCNANHHE